MVAKPEGSPVMTASGAPVSRVCALCLLAATTALRSRASGQAQHGGGAAARGFLEEQVAALAPRGIAGDGQAQADAAGVAVA